MSEYTIRASLDQRALVKASQVLTGIITGIVADGHLHNAEVQMLSTWLSANEAATCTWPGNAIARLLQEVLADGRIDEAERTHLLTELQALVGSDFADTGSVDTGVAKLPYDTTDLNFEEGLRICLTGEFLYGTRNACEKLAIKARLEPSQNVSKKVYAVVVGTHASPDWVNASYGTKIRRAMELREDGHHIRIVRESDWLSAIQNL